jgi:ligand-binding sensor domain-containing protein
LYNNEVKPQRKWWTSVAWVVSIYIVLVLANIIIPEQVDIKPVIKGWIIARPPHEVSAMVIQGDTVWTGGDDGVYAINRKNGSLIKQLQANPELKHVRALLVDKKGQLWIGHQDGLTIFDGKSFETLTQKDGLPDNRVNALMKDRDGRTWIGTWRGVVIVEGGRWKTLTAKDGLIHEMVNVIIQDKLGGMWFGSYVAPVGGISYLKEGKWQHFSKKNGLPHNNITALMECNDGSVWTGTGLAERGGACRFVFDGQKWVIDKVLGKDDGLAGQKVRSLFQDKDGILWFGSEYDGIARGEVGKWTVYTQKSGLSNNEVKVIRQDVDGNLWLGTRNGVTMIDNNTLNSLK